MSGRVSACRKSEMDDMRDAAAQRVAGEKAQAADLVDPVSLFPGSGSVKRYLRSSFHPRTAAERSNTWRVTAWAYEPLWRRFSTVILTRGAWNLKKECRLVCDMLEPEDGCVYLDVGCSTGVYARAIAMEKPESRIVLADYSLPMLKKAMAYAGKSCHQMTNAGSSCEQKAVDGRLSGKANYVGGLGGKAGCVGRLSDNADYVGGLGDKAAYTGRVGDEAAYTGRLSNKADYAGRLSEQMAYVQCDAAEMPFPDDSFDGLAMGGTLNELTEPLRVLCEMARVLKHGKKAVVMHLVKKRPVETLIQKMMKKGGVWLAGTDDVDQMFREAGFTILDSKMEGVMRLSLLTLSRSQ